MKGKVPQCIRRLSGELLTLHRMRKLVFLWFCRISVSRSTVPESVSGRRFAPPCCAGQSVGGCRHRRLQPVASRAAKRFSPGTTTEETCSSFALQALASSILRLAPKHQVGQARSMAPVAHMSLAPPVSMGPGQERWFLRQHRVPGRKLTPRSSRQPPAYRFTLRGNEVPPGSAAQRNVRLQNINAMCSLRERGSMRGHHCK